MKRYRKTVPKGFNIRAARRAQALIKDMVIEQDLLKGDIRRVVGVDVTYIDDIAIAAAVILDESFRVIDKATVVTKVVFPYIPTLLAFREVYPAYRALRKLSSPFDIVFVDGNGRLHPYKAGFACHLGVILRIPTIGIAKRLLCGRIDKWIGDKALVIMDHDIIGCALKTLSYAKPIFVSVGYGISLNTAVKIVKRFTLKRRKLPEPIVQAHNLARATARIIQMS